MLSKKLTYSLWVWLIGLTNVSINSTKKKVINLKCLYTIWNLHTPPLLVYLFLSPHQPQPLQWYFSLPGQRYWLGISSSGKLWHAHKLHKNNKIGTCWTSEKAEDGLGRSTASAISSLSHVHGLAKTSWINIYRFDHCLGFGYNLYIYIHILME